MKRWLVSGPTADIDGRLAEVFGRGKMAATQVDAKTFPYYRFVDLFKAADKYFASRQDVVALDSQHDGEILKAHRVPVRRGVLLYARRVQGRPSLAGICAASSRTSRG